MTSNDPNVFLKQFLKNAPEDAKMIICPFSPENSNKKSFPADSIIYEEGMKFIDHLQFYFTPNLRTKLYPSQDTGRPSQGKKQAVKYCTAFFADIDYGELGHKKPSKHKTLEEALTAVKGFPLTPSCVVHSGHGLQAYWFFEKPLEIGKEIELAEYEGLQRGLQLALKSDTTADIGRIFRIAGTYNLKEEAKLAEILEIHDKRYSLDEFKVHITPVDISSTSNQVLIFKFVDLKKEPNERVKKILKTMVDPQNPENTDHSSVMHACIQSLIWQRFTDNEIYTILIEKNHAMRDHIINKKSTEESIADYISRSINKLRDQYKEEQKKILLALTNNVEIDLFAPKYSSNLDEIANSMRFIDIFGIDLKYSYPQRSWLIWDDKKWEEDSKGKITFLAMNLIKAMHHQVKAFSSLFADNDLDEEALKEQEKIEKAKLNHISKSAKNHKIKSFLELSQNRVAILPDELDANKFLLNTLSGTIDLKTGEIREPRREDLITRLINYKIENTAPLEWLNFLNDIFSGDQGLINYIQKCVGHALTGDVSEHAIWFLYGTGRNGKTTFLNVLRHLFGEYSEILRAENLMKQRDDSTSYDIAKLKGKRFVIASEGELNRSLAEAKIKILTGGDRLVGRFLYKDEFSFDPSHHIFFATNHKPRIQGTDDGIWRRIKLIPFNYKVPKEKLDPHLEEKLIQEAPQILGWAVDGCLKWQKEGLKPEPAVVTSAIEEYRQESDDVGLFLTEKTVADINGKLEMGSLYQNFVEWCDENKVICVRKKDFSSRMIDKGFGKFKGGSNGTWHWTGLLYKTPENKEYTIEEIQSDERYKKSPEAVFENDSKDSEDSTDILKVFDSWDDSIFS